MMDALAEGFWWLLTMTTVLWYMTVTVWVGVRGATDIRSMIARIVQQSAAEGDHVVEE